MSASVLLVAIGVIDDRFHLPSAVRFAAQITVALIMVYGAGLSLADVGNPFGIGVISLGPFGLIFTVCVTLTSDPKQICFCLMIHTASLVSMRQKAANTDEPLI